jgi:hypothetical protein
MELQAIPIITSIVAILISGFNFGWNIYKDAIRTPKFKVSIAIKKIIQKGHPEEGPYVFLEALNMGPIPNRIGLPFARQGWLQRKVFDRKHGSAMIYPDFSHWASTKSSTRVEVGDIATFIFPYAAKSFLSETFSEIGVSDGFGRMHWASRQELRKAKTKHAAEFKSDGT